MLRPSRRSGSRASALPRSRSVSDLITAQLLGVANVIRVEQRRRARTLRRDASPFAAVGLQGERPAQVSLGLRSDNGAAARCSERNPSRAAPPGADTPAGCFALRGGRAPGRAPCPGLARSPI